MMPPQTRADCPALSRSRVALELDAGVVRSVIGVPAIANTQNRALAVKAGLTHTSTPDQGLGAREARCSWHNPKIDGTLAERVVGHRYRVDLDDRRAD
jgi:hypothetical protein